MAPSYSSNFDPEIRSATASFYNIKLWPGLRGYVRAPFDQVQPDIYFLVFCYAFVPITGEGRWNWDFRRTDTHDVSDFLAWMEADYHSWKI